MPPSKLSVVIPTMTGREESFERAILGYTERTPCEVEFIVRRDAPTCGQGWTEGADLATGDYIHLGADDVVPDFDWCLPAFEAINQGKSPANCIVIPDPESLDDFDMPSRGAPGSKEVFYENPDSSPENVSDWEPAAGGVGEYAAAPLMSREQWEKVRPVIPTTYGTDKWVSEKMVAAGYPVVARHGFRIYHYTAHAGRVQDGLPGWMHTDILTFDMCVAYPEYASGQRDPSEPHPLRGTAEGRKLSRDWYRTNVPGPWPWEIDPTLPSQYLETT